MPHRIRLGEPWKIELADARDGVHRLRRRFNSPTGIATNDRVWLQFDRLPIAACVLLNDESLDGDMNEVESWQCEIASQIRPSNEIVVEMPMAVMHGNLKTEGALAIFGEVRLVIEER